jgi:hypothetical protein
MRVRARVRTGIRIRQHQHAAVAQAGTIGVRLAGPQAQDGFEVREVRLVRLRKSTLDDN